MRILVIEDDRSVRETIGVVLSAFFHDVVLAGNGDEALQAFDDPGRPIDVVLLDLRLLGPTGEERGEDVHARIQKRLGRVPPTVVISAAAEGAERAARMPGPVGYLAKPYTVDELLASIERAQLSSAKVA